MTDVLDVARVDQPRQMNDDRGAQSRAEIRRLCRQIAHALIKGKIQLRLNKVVHLRRRAKCLRNGQTGRHHLYLEMIVLIDENTDPQIGTDVGCALRLPRSELLTDEPLFDQHRPLHIRQRIDSNALKRLPERRADIRQCLI